ncbi:MAG: efflux RND transporter permease subunit, partial [Gammaproteobacteria bacterium]
MNNNHRLYFSPDNPQLVAFNALENTFVKNDTVTFVVAPADRRVFTAETLAIVEALTARAWQIPFSNRVDSITNFQHSTATGDDLLVGDLVTDAANMGTAEIENIQSIALGEPLLNNALIRRDAAVTAVNVVVQLPRQDESHEVPQVVNAARALVADFERTYPGLKIHLTGLVMMDHAFAEAALRDTETLVPLSFLAMLVLIGVLVGGLAGTVCTLLVIGCAILAAMGIGGYIGYPISAATSAAPIVILTVAIANCVHLLQTYRRELGAGAAQDAAIHTALCSNLKPIFLASLTTVIGFLTFNFSDVPPFRHLGNLVAFGDTWSYLLAITLFPALLSILPTGPPRRRVLDPQLMPRCAEFVIRHYRALFLGIGALALLLLAWVPRNELN